MVTKLKQRGSKIWHLWCLFLIVKGQAVVLAGPTQSLFSMCEIMF